MIAPTIQGVLENQSSQGNSAFPFDRRNHPLIKVARLGRLLPQVVELPAKRRYMRPAGIQALLGPGHGRKENGMAYGVDRATHSSNDSDVMPRDVGRNQGKRSFGDLAFLLGKGEH